MDNDELGNLKENYSRIKCRLANSEIEKSALKCEAVDLQTEHKKLLDRLEDTQQEAEGTKEWANTLHNELLTLRGQVTAYKHCIAAMTGTEIPTEVTGENSKIKL